MGETVYSAQPELARPRRFLTAAAQELRHAPPLAWALFRSSLASRHRRAGLGYLWLLLPTVAMTVVCVYVESRQLVAVGETPLPYPLHVYAGMLLWQAFVESLNAPLQQLTAGRSVISRRRVPHEAYVLSGLFEALLNAGVRLAGLVVLGFAYGVPPVASMLLVPAGVVAVCVFGLALGLLAAPAGMLYDDVARGLVLLTTLWFFLTPVFYRAPVTGAVRFNPVTPLIETTRGWLTSAAPAGGFAAVTLLSLATLVVAWLFYQVARPHVVARLG